MNPSARRWARRLAPVTVEVACGGENHRVLLRRGKVVLEHHVLGAEAAAVALGAPSPPCFEVYRSWRAREQWEIALQPRGPGFHQLYRRPPLPAPLLDPLERGIARSWERRAARDEGLAAYVLHRSIRAKAEPALATAFETAVRAVGGGPIKRLELSIGVAPWVSGKITPTESTLFVRVAPDWLRTVGHPRRSLDGQQRFVAAAEPSIKVVGWQATAEGEWTSHLTGS